MESASDWWDVCVAIGQHNPPDLSPAWRKLHEMATTLGRAVLSRKWKYRDDAAQDIVHDVLAERWREIVAAESPKALFTTILTNRAISLHRKAGRMRPTSDEDLAAMRDGSAAAQVVVAGHAHDLAKVLSWLSAHLSERDCRVLVRRLEGESSQHVARDEGLTEGNVDQIVARAKRAVRGAFA